MARSAHPWFYEAKNTWYVWNEGRKISLGVHGKENRDKAYKAWHERMANGRPNPKSRSPILSEIVQAFLADAETRLKPATVRGYRDFLHPFVEKYGQERAERLTRQQAESYVRGKNWSQSTCHGFLSALLVAFAWAERAQLLASNPLKHLRKPPMESRGDKVLISAEAHERLLKAAPSYFQPFLRLLHLTGARPAELAAITAENFDSANAVVRLKEHKTARHGKPRTIFLSPAAVTLLEELRANCTSGALLRNRYGQVYTKNAIVHMMASLRKKTGIQATAYGYRHSFATEALAQGVSDAQVAALMGHSDTAMLHRHYSHLTSQSQVLKDALNRVRRA